MATQDESGNFFNVGDVVNVPIVVTAIGGTPANPTVTGTTKYAGFNAATDSIGPIDSVQVLVAK
jgi:hypothetical protein